MFNNRGNSGEDEVDNDDDNLPQHIFVSTQSSNQSKSSQVSIIYILLTLYLFFSLSTPPKRDAALNAEVILFLNHLVPCHH